MKKYRFLLSLVLVFVFLSSYIYRFMENHPTNLENSFVIATEYSKDTLEFLVSLENKIEVEKDMAQRHHLTYQEMYPDLYVKSIQPIIQLAENKVAYLTFDDGPSENTEKVMSTLTKYKVKATFFVIGCTLTKDNEKYLIDMVEQGHVIGIHTFSHNYKTIYSSVDSYLEDFYKVYELIYHITGVKSNIFRFPWGSYNGYGKNIKEELVAELERRGFIYYDWNVSGEDSVGRPSGYEIKKNIMKDLERYNNPIILLHDASVNKTTAKSLADIIEVIQEKNYSFDTLNHREPFHFNY